VARFLNRQGLVAEALSSDLNQRARERVMARIKLGEIDFLVATDIAARGIDISDLSHVINYALPEDPAVYLHRTGRTGRAGKTGIAISFMGGREISCRKILEHKYEIDFEERTLPSREDAERLWSERHLTEMRNAVNEGLAFEGFLGMARDIRSRGDQADALIAIALRGFFRWHRMRSAQTDDSAEPAGEESRREGGGNHRSGGNRGRGGRRGGSHGGGGRGGSSSGGGRGGRRNGGGQR
jgi:ATP-dependent RNA helicase DeaD